MLITLFPNSSHPHPQPQVISISTFFHIFGHDRSPTGLYPYPILIYNIPSQTSLLSLSPINELLCMLFEKMPVKPLAQACWLYTQ